MGKYADESDGIICAWFGGGGVPAVQCGKPADTDGCPWGPFWYCTEHDDLMNAEAAKHFARLPPEDVPLTPFFEEGPEDA